MKYAFIQRQRREWPISVQCRVLEVSVAGYHEHFVRRASAAQRRHLSDDARQVKAHQTMTIGAAGAETAQLLRVPAGTPVAEVARVFKDCDDKLIYFANVAYRGDWVQWQIDLKP